MLNVPNKLQILKLSNFFFLSIGASQKLANDGTHITLQKANEPAPILLEKTIVHCKFVSVIPVNTAIAMT